MHICCWVYTGYRWASNKKTKSVVSQKSRQCDFIHILCVLFPHFSELLCQQQQPVISALSMKELLNIIVEFLAFPGDDITLVHNQTGINSWLYNIYCDPVRNTERIRKLLLILMFYSLVPYCIFITHLPREYSIIYSLVNKRKLAVWHREDR